jgi:hypothetical protein
VAASSAEPFIKRGSSAPLKTNLTKDMETHHLISLQEAAETTETEPPIETPDRSHSGTPSRSEDPADHMTAGGPSASPQDDPLGHMWQLHEDTEEGQQETEEAEDPRNDSTKKPQDHLIIRNLLQETGEDLILMILTELHTLIKDLKF